MSENSTDATRGEPLGVRALKRRAELAVAVGSLGPTDNRARVDLELAIAEIDTHLTGDHSHLTETTASEINRWLERSKHLAERSGAVSRPPRAGELGV